MSKTLFAGLATLVLFFGLIGTAGAISFTDYQDFHSTVLYASSTNPFTWSHAVPADFQVPYDTVTDASLAITSRRAVGDNDVVTVIDFGTLGFLGADGNSPFTTSFDLEGIGVFTAWNTGEQLNLSLAYSIGAGNTNSTYLTMVSSLFTLNYNNVDAPVDPVPEPVSMLLFGTGLVGVGGYLRKKFKNKEV